MSSRACPPNRDARELWVWAADRWHRIMQDAPRSGRFRRLLRSLPWLIGELVIQAKWAVLRLPTFSIVDRMKLLDEACARAPSAGLWLEFGVWTGRSINQIARSAPGVVFGFDSFVGLPERWSPQMPAGYFSTGGSLPPVGPQVRLVKGWFSDTLPGFLRDHPCEPVAFLHVDCDLYSSTRTVLSLLEKRLVPGSVIVFDEYCQALPDDEERAWREFAHAHGVAYEYLGASITGSVALWISGRRDPLAGKPMSAPYPAPS